MVLIAQCPFCHTSWLGIQIDAGDEVSIPYLCNHQVGVDCDSFFLLLEHVAIGLLQPTDGYGSPIVTLNIELEEHQALIQVIRSEAISIDSSGTRFAVVENLEQWVQVHRGPVPEKVWPWPLYGPDAGRLANWAQTYAWLDAGLEQVGRCGRFSELALCPSCHAPDVRLDPQSDSPSETLICGSCAWRPDAYDAYPDVLVAYPPAVKN